MGKKLTFLLLIIGLIGVSGYLLHRGGSELFSRKYHEVIPFQTFSTNAMIIPVTIGGKRYHFQFDTGASTSVSRELADTLNLTIIGSAESRDYYNNKKQVEQAILPHLTIGKTSFEQVQVGIIRPIQNFTSQGIRIDGYLGNDVLSKGVVQIDMRHQQLTIASSLRYLDVERHNSIDFQVNNQMIPYLLVHFPGQDASGLAMFDTGSANYHYRLERSSFQQMVNNKQLTSKNILDTLGLSANGSGAFGKQQEKEILMVNFDSISFIGKTIYNCPAYTFTSGYNSVIGSPFLQLGLVTINYRDQKFYFKPYDDQLIDLSPLHGKKRRTPPKRQLVVETILNNSLDQNPAIGKDYVFKKLNFTLLDSLSVGELFRLNWPKEMDKDSVDYLFLTKEKGKEK